MKFTQAEVTRFCNLVGDTNEIHQPEVGIVPGLMTTSVITQNPAPGIMLGDLKVRYHNPLYVNEEFDLDVISAKEKLGSVFIHYEIKTRDRVIQKIQCTLVKTDKK